MMNVVGHSKGLMNQTMKGFNSGGEMPKPGKSLLYGVEVNGSQNFNAKEFINNHSLSNGGGDS
jgi:hypothetical protein